jgi:UDP-N-acetylmuramoylalanine--D-glutamate ligase
VLLNIAPDHLDRHGTMREYEAAKLRIFAAQPSGAVAVLPCELRERVAAALAEAAALPDAAAVQRRFLCFGGDRGAEVSLREDALWWREDERLVSVAELRLRGPHNVENAMAAAAACLAYGVPIEAVREGLRTFAGVAHRLEEVATRAGVLYVNDSKATNVASTLVALDAFGEQRVHLILGGQGKGQDFSPLRGPVERACAGVYLIGEDALALAGALASLRPPLHECGDLEHALGACERAARAGEVVLLSPACASFDQFADFEARGERFRELVAARANGGLRERASK